MPALDKSFRAVLQKSPSKGGWTYVVMPGSAEFFGTKGLVKVSGTNVHPLRHHQHSFLVPDAGLREDRVLHLVSRCEYSPSIGLLVLMERAPDRPVIRALTDAH
jgi:hypothetical protein